MRDAAERGPAMPRRIELIFLLGALSTFGPLSIDMYLPAFPVLETQFGTTPSLVQATLSACLLGLAFGQVVAGPLSDAFGRRKPLVVGVAGYALFSFLCALAPSVEALIAFRLLQGLCGAAGLVIARAIVRDMYSGAEMAKFFSVLMLVSGTAPILAPIAGGQLLRVVDWPGVFVALGVIGVVFAVAATLRLPETLDVTHRHPANLRATLGVFRRLLGDRAFTGFALTLGLTAAGMFAYIAGSTFVLQEIYGASPQRFSVYFGMNAVGIMIMGQINARLVGRVGTERMLGIGVTATATGGTLFLAMIAWGGGGLISVLPPLWIAIAALGFVYPNVTALAMAGHGRNAGSASAMLGVTQFVVGALAAPLVGIAGSGTALPMGLCVAGGMLAALAMFRLVALPASRRAAAVAAARSAA